MALVDISAIVECDVTIGNVDLGTPDQRDQYLHTAQLLVAHLSQQGFLHVSNHGIPIDVIRYFAVT